MNPSPIFQPGQVVKLKSGGPRMTVFGESPLGFLNCGWFVDGVLQGNIFNPMTLMLATDDQPASPQHGPLYVNPDYLNAMCTFGMLKDDGSYEEEGRFDIVNGSPREVPQFTQPDGRPVTPRRIACLRPLQP